jgi:hypothetical protein
MAPVRALDRRGDLRKEGAVNVIVRRDAPRIPLNVARNEDRRISVYLIASGPYLKIGVSENVRRRLEDLMAGNAHEMRIVMTRSAPRYLGMEIEKRLHLRFAAYRHRGEWFTCDVDAAKQALKEEIRDIPRLLRMDRQHLVAVQAAYDQSRLGSS